MKRSILIIAIVSAMEIAFSLSLVAQSAKSSHPKTITKEISIEEDGNNTKVVVTTTENGNTEVEEYTGEEAKKYLEENEKSNGINAQHHMVFISEDGEQHEIDIDKIMQEIELESVEDGSDNHKVIIKSFDFDFDFDEDMKMDEVEIQKLTNEILEKHMLHVQDGDTEVGTELDGNSLIIKGSKEELQKARACMKELEVEILEHPKVMKKVIIIDEEDIIKKEDSEGKKVIQKKKVIDVEDNENNTNLKSENVELNVYPNPNDGQFKIELDLPSKKKANISITDVNGKEIYTTTIKGNNNYIVPVDVSEKSGIYLLNITQGDLKIIEKIVLD